MPIARKVIQRYWRMTRGLTLGVRAAVFDTEDRVLLVRHTYAHGWHFPGGGVEFRETIHTALERELLEETGVGLANPPPELFAIYSNAQQFPGDHVALFIVRGWEQRRVFRPTAEIAEAKFFPSSALPDGASAGTRRRMDELGAGRPAQPYW